MLESLSEGRGTTGLIGLNPMMLNKTMHRMSGMDVSFRLGHHEVPLIGDFIRSAAL